MQTNRSASNHPTRIRDTERKPDFGKRTDGSEANPRSRCADSSNRPGDRLKIASDSRTDVCAYAQNARQSR